MKKISFTSGRYALWREDAIVGDCGMLLVSLNPENGEPIGQNGDVIVGCRIQCGSTYARSYQMQDWWMTSIVEEIVEEHDGWALIKTKNNLYYVGDSEAVSKQMRERARRTDSDEHIEL